MRHREISLPQSRYKKQISKESGVDLKFIMFVGESNAHSELFIVEFQLDPDGKVKQIRQIQHLEKL